VNAELLPPSYRIAARRLVAGALALLLFGGCLSVRSRQAQGQPGEGGGVSLTIYADDDARKAGTPGPPGLSSQLSCLQDGTWVSVFRSLQPVWTVTGLPAGRCRVSFPQRFDESGELQALDEKSRNLRVRDGEVTEVEATLSHVSTGLIVAGVAVGVVAAVLLHDWLGDADLPTPPLPPEPPPWWIADLAAHIVIDLALAPRAHVEGPYGPGPVVSGHHPANLATVEADGLEIVFSLAQAVELQRIDSGGVEVLDSRGARVSGYLQYDAEQWWLVWRPDEPLRSGESYHVTLAADAVTDVQGRGFPRDLAFYFSTR
jgi:hypothetical protein